MPTIPSVYLVKVLVAQEPAGMLDSSLSTNAIMFPGTAAELYGSFWTIRESCDMIATSESFLGVNKELAVAATSSRACVLIELKRFPVTKTSWWFPFGDFMMSTDSLEYWAYYCFEIEQGGPEGACFLTVCCGLLAKRRCR